MVTFTATARNTAGVAATAQVTVPVSGTASFQSPAASFWGASVPPGSFVADPRALEIGMQFYTFRSGVITGIRWWRDPGNTDTSRTARLWDQAGNLLGTASFTFPETANAWNTATFGTPVHVSGLSGSTTPASYIFSVTTSSGYFSTNGTRPLGPIQMTVLPLVMICSGDTSWPLPAQPYGNGWFTTTQGTFPQGPTYGDIYGADIAFQSDPQQDDPPLDSTYWGRWSGGYPSSPSFFPLTVWDQDP